LLALVAVPPHIGDAERLGIVLWYREDHAIVAVTDDQREIALLVGCLDCYEIEHY
jgi:hypothetical protein